MGRENPHRQKLMIQGREFTPFIEVGLKLPLPTATAGLRTVEYAMPSPKAATH